jgi:hypothetical protein
MINVSTETILPIYILKAMTKPLIGDSLTGYNGGTSGTIARMLDTATQAEQDIVTATYAGYAAGTVALGTITEDSGVYTIPITGTVDNTDTQAVIRIWDSGQQLDFEETLTVTNGQCSYSMETAITDKYTIAIYGTISKVSAIGVLTIS